MKELKYGSPESVGISSDAIRHLMERLQEQHICMNSLLIARHGIVVSESYYRPYRKNKLHRMFSVTKSLVSLAIGLLEADGRLQLTDPILAHFPEYARDDLHPWLRKTTIRDMLTMRSCHANTTYDLYSTTKNWVESFFTTAPTNPPGSLFQYDTSASHVLCALVEKLAGQDLLDFLKDRFLRKLGWSEESYVIKDPFGTSMGGAGLMALPEDLLRLGLFLNQKETERGGLYPESYLREAVRKQVSVSGWNRTCAGYGYQFWMLPDAGFAMIGRADQDLLCFPELDLVLAYTADTEELENLAGFDLIYDTIREELLKKLSEKELPENPEGYAKLQEKSRQAELPIVQTECERPIVRADTEDWYEMAANPAAYEKMRIRWESDREGILEYQRGESHLCPDTRRKKESGIFQIPFGIGTLKCGRFPEYEQDYAASAAWIEPRVLLVRIWLVDERIGNIQIRLHFGEEGSLTVWMKKQEESSFELFQGIFTGLRQGRDAECCICQG